MYVRQKLNAIIRRVRYYGQKMSGEDGEYKEGFMHAINLVQVGMRVELSDFVQVSINHEFEKRDMEKEISILKTKLAKIKHYSSLLEAELTKKQLSNKKKTNICRVIAHMTGQPYDVIKQEFQGYLDGKETINQVGLGEGRRHG